MRVAIFSDIHANREAFDACLAHAARQSVERYVFLGDLVGYGADPQYVVDRVVRFAEDGAVVLKGNHDEAATTGANEGMNDYARKAIDWTFNQLDDASRDFLSSLPIFLEEEDRLYVHSEATMPAEWRYITDAATAERSMRATAKRITFCGHVHIPQLYNMSPQKPAQYFEPKPNIAIPLIGQRQWLAVMGATGQPRDKNPAAAYAVLDTTKKDITYFRIAYDMEPTSKKIHAAGLPAILAARLFVGR
jgi:diadenosine tetraphosphatase ApaH/serine/threonine PP2A family protein phosphatase